MTTTSETTTRRVRVKRVPLPGLKPWRVQLETGQPGDEPVHVGRFDDQLEAITTGCSALRFVNAGITWQPVGDQ